MGVEEKEPYKPKFTNEELKRFEAGVPRFEDESKNDAKEEEQDEEA